MSNKYYTLFNKELEKIDTFDYQPDKTCKHFLDELINNMVIHNDSIHLEKNCNSIIGQLAVWCKNKYSIDTQHSSELFKHKNQDYGNAFELCGKVGIMVRLMDKLKRILHLETSTHTIHYETIMDTYIDIFNYTILYRIVE